MFSTFHKPPVQKTRKKITVSEAFRKWGADDMVRILKNMDAEGRINVEQKGVVNRYQLVLEIVLEEPVIMLPNLSRRV